MEINCWLMLILFLFLTHKGKRYVFTFSRLIQNGILEVITNNIVRSVKFNVNWTILRHGVRANFVKIFQTVLRKSFKAIFLKKGFLSANTLKYQYIENNSSIELVTVSVRPSLCLFKGKNLSSIIALRKKDVKKIK